MKNPNYKTMRLNHDDLLKKGPLNWPSYWRPLALNKVD